MVAKKVRISPSKADKVRFAKALDDIDALFAGPWRVLLEEWQQTPKAQRSADGAPLFSRLVKIAERLV